MYGGLEVNWAQGGLTYIECHVSWRYIVCRVGWR